MSRLNGFQRLWLVSCGIVAIALVITFFVTKPKESDFTARIWPEKDDWRAATLKASSEELNELFRTQRAPSDAQVKAISDRMEKKIAEGIAAIDQRYAGYLEQYTVSHNREIGGYFLVWLYWTVLTYAIGWISVWIYRGFRPKSDSRS